MHASTLPRIAASLLFVALVGCDQKDPAPTAVRARTIPLALRTPNIRTAAIRERVAAKRHQGLTREDKARVASLSGKWKWVADLHHQAMQEAIHTTSTGPRTQRPEAQTCDIMRRYGDKYAAIAEQTAGTLRMDRQAFQAEIARTLGVCQGPQQASLFAASRAGFRRGAGVFESTGSPTFDSVRAVYRDYVTAMLDDMHAARDLGDANDIMDQYLVAAGNDHDVSPDALAALAGTIDLARSSAEEWDTYARAHQGSLFLWGWLSDLGDWIVGVIEWDVGGCATGFVTGWSYVEDSGGYYGSLGGAAELSAAFCGVGAFGSSLYKAFAE